MITRYRSLVRQLASRALAFGLHGRQDAEAVADELVTAAAGNRAAVELALRRIQRQLDARTPVCAGSRAVDVLRLALARGCWRWSGPDLPL